MKTRQSGFNLIELLIVIVILALLATIAFPSYQSFIRNSRLANVRSELLQNAAMLERYYTQKRTFIGFESADLIQNQYFDISFVPAAANLTDNNAPASSSDTSVATSTDIDDRQANPSASGFILQAVPNADYAETESCTVYMNDSGIFWAISKDSEICPGYEEAHS